MADLRRIFIGGTGRSGTTVTSRLLDAHPDLRRIPNEARFHAADGGLADVVRGEIELDEFLAAMRGHWYLRERKGREKGLSVLVPRDDYEELLASFAETHRDDPVGAGRTLLLSLLDPLADGAAGWVEHTPANARAAATLAQMVPEGVMLHVVRDGRDAATSASRKGWGPRRADPVSSVRHWAIRSLHIARQTAQWPPERFLAFRLEDLVVHSRDETYARLLAVLDVPDAPEMREFLDREMSADNANMGRWRGEERAAGIDLAYRAGRLLLRSDPSGAELDRLLGPDDTDPGDPAVRAELETLIDFGGLVTAQVEAHVGKLTGRKPRRGLLKRLRGR